MNTKMNPLLLIVLVTLAGHFQHTNALCDKTPDKSVTLAAKINGNNGFAIGIVGSPRLYRPGQQYEITLEGTAEDPNEAPRFTNFMLAAEPVSTNPNHRTPMGIMEIRSGDPMVMYSGKCSNSIKESSSIMKDHISVFWTAPSEQELESAPEGSSGCLEFRAMVIERQDNWYMNDGALTYRMCKDTSFKAPSAVMEDIPPCTACKEAKYELIFEGIWSRHTHPKDFPVDEWRTQFSKLIGASHSNPNTLPNGAPKPNGYSLWSYGKKSSEALEYLAKYGITRRLEAQMKLFSGDIRSVIKARGLEQRSNVAGQTFAVFRVDSVHHLLSFVTKMIPSPDWIVGVSNENLCLSNGSWTNHRTIDLYPADAGVDSGMKYSSPDQPTRGHEMIQRITSSNPDDRESPFWDENRTPMKPVARLHLIKQREYEKRCPPNNGQRGMGGIGNPSIGMFNAGGMSNEGGNSFVVQQGPGMGGNIPNDYGRSDDTYRDTSPVSEYDDFGADDQNAQGSNNADDACMTTEWSYWSECSQSCGKRGNSQTHFRKFMYPRKANRAQCAQTTKLTEKQPCRHLDDCPPKRYDIINPFPDVGNENGMNGYSTPWRRRGFESRNQLRPQVPGNAGNSYVYQSGGSNDNNNVELGRQPMNGKIRNNAGGREGNIRQGMYGYGNRLQQGNANNQRRKQPISYYYGGDSRGRQADEISELPMQQARYQTRPQGDRSSPSSEPNCDVSTWGEWSECSRECDEGSRTRSRHYISQGSSSGDCDKELTDIIPCTGDGPDCPGSAEDSYPTNVAYNGFGVGFGASRNKQVDEVSEDCATADWSDWSPCSSKCSQGTQRRTRLYKIPFVEGPRRCDVQLIEPQMCWGDSNDISCQTNYGQISYRNDQNYPYNNNIDFEPLDDENSPYPDSSSNELEKCSLEKNEGASRCVSHYTRWHYDSTIGECKEFTFTGCGGNQNNFESRSLCMAACSNEVDNGIYSEIEGNLVEPEVTTMTVLEYDGDNNGLVSENLIRLTPEQESQGVFSPPRMGRPPKPVDCQASAWSEWTTCTKTCGSGWTTREREILLEAGEDGRPCPKKLHRKRKCNKMPCPADTKYWYQGSWRHIGQN